METMEAKDVTGGRRSVMQQAKLAIRDIFDALVELITNCDDRYQQLGISGTIEIEIERGGGTDGRALRVRDHADGMTLDAMDEKLTWTGGRFSGLEEGFAVRGTNSRGAKDIAALGNVTFESIAASDGKFHCSEISSAFRFRALGTEEASPAIRKRTGLLKKSGMLVTVRVGDNPIPRFDNLKDKIQRLVSLRDILSDPKRKIILRDSSQKKTVVLKAPQPDGKDRLKATIEIPGYPGVTAKLIIKRAGSAFEREPNRFRRGGILVKSRHTIHEATYFDAELERDNHAAWFYGKLTCPHIDDLWNDLDDRFEKDLPPESSNPVPILDPSRQTGLTRSHPFVSALYAEVLKRLRPLVDEERRKDEHQQAEIESRATRKRLDALEKAAAKFMKDSGEEDEDSRDPDHKQLGSHFRNHGYMLSPPFAQMVVGHTRQFGLTINQEVFPEFEVGANIEIACVTPEIQTGRRFVALEPHPTRDATLRASWKVKAVKATPATGLRVAVGSIKVVSAIEVFATEADKYKDVTTLCFARKRYKIYTNGARKKIRVLAPLDLVPVATEMDVALSSPHFRVVGAKTIKPHPELGVSIGEFTVKSDSQEAQGEIEVQVDSLGATAEIRSGPAPGAGLKIKIGDVSHGNQRSKWKQNVLEVAARHPSLARYLGAPPDFPGQESRHFRVLLAEIVADAVCARTLERNIEADPEDYEEADWNQYYADYTRHMTRFLPVAHKVQLPESG